MAKTKEEIQAEADAEIESLKPQYVQETDAETGEKVRRERTEEEYDQAKIDLANDNWEKQQFGYIWARQQAYPSIVDFVEAYTEKEIGEDDKKWTAYVEKYNKARSDNPKPE